MPIEFSDDNYFRPCKGELVPVPGRPNRMRIITEFGHVMEIDLNLKLQVNAVEEFHPPFDGQPAYDWDIVGDYVDKTFKAAPFTTDRDKIIKLLTLRNRIPEKLNYDYFYIGYVFAIKPGDPTDNHWWLDFRDSKDKPVKFYLFPLEIRIDIPVFTHHWRVDNDDMWHGRYKVMKKDVGALFEPGVLSFILKGKEALEKNPKPEIYLTHNDTHEPKKRKSSKLEYVKGLKDPFKIRTYFNVWNCRWIVEVRTEQGIVLQKKEYPNLILNVPQIGIAERMKPRSRISFETMLADIGSIEEIASTLIITR